MNLCLLHLKGYRLIEKRLIERMESSGVTGLTLSNGMVFPYLTEQGIRSSELASKLGISRQAAHKTVRHLSDLGFIYFDGDPEHKGAKLAKLTKKGLEAKKHGEELLAEIENELVAEFGTETIRQLRECLTACWGDKDL